MASPSSSDQRAVGQPKVSRKRSVTEENRQFDDEWTDAFFVVPSPKAPGFGSICLICKESIAVNKEYNIKRHFSTKHSEYNNKYPLKSLERKAHVSFLRQQLSAQQNIFTRGQSLSNAAHEASLKVAWILCKHKKPYSDVEVVSECCMQMTNTLFIDDTKLRDKVKLQFNAVPLSRRSVTRRSDELTMDIETQLKDDIHMCEFYSLSIDESCDTTDISQLAVFIRMVFSDASIKDEFLSLEPLLSTTRGQDAYDALIELLKRFNVPHEKLVSVTTDGAPSMIGVHNGLIALLRLDLTFPKFRSYHCIIHQENLCASRIGYVDVIQSVIKIVNSIRASPLRHRQFREFIEDMNTEFEDVEFYNQVRWLSRGNVLKRVFSLRVEILAFLHDHDREHHQLCDEVWLTKLAFLTDITKHLNDLNLKLQGQQKFLPDMLMSIDAFKNKLKLFRSHLESHNWTHFPALGEIMTNVMEYPTGCNFIVELDHLMEVFEARFQECNDMKLYLRFIRDPIGFDPNDFNDTFVHDVGVAQLELLELKSNDELVDNHSKLSLDLFWQKVDNSYPTLKTAAKKVLVMFGSTYCCEQLFSQMNFVKNRLRNRLTQYHVICQLRAAVNSYLPRFATIKQQRD